MARYVALPGIIPRAKELGSMGFCYLAFLFACVYRSVRILPNNHPFVDPNNIGKFGLVQVMAAAANNIEIKRGNIDQIIVFLALVAAVILMILQFVMLILGLLAGKAYAQNPGFTSMFETQFPETDIAFLMLDYVFGIPSGGTAGSSFFGSNALMETGGPTPFHLGMHALFQFYNFAILLVGVLIFLYYVVVVVIETAQTGVPFGKRFSKIYAPFRLVIAIGLLVPLGYGFNGAQYITLTLAKMGSSFATNGWILFNENVQNPTGFEDRALVAKPHVAPLDELLYFSAVYHTCREFYELWVPKHYGRTDTPGRTIRPYVIIDGNAHAFLSYAYRQAKTDFAISDMQVVLGELDENEHKSYAGGVRPYCGVMNISLNFDNPAGYVNRSGRPGNPQSQSGIRAIEEMYYTTVQNLLREQDVFAAYGERMAHVFKPSGNDNTSRCHASGTLGDDATCDKIPTEPPSASFTSMLNNYNTANKVNINNAYEQFRNGIDLKMSDEIKRRGWGGAGIWYNAIADINGAFTGAIYATPSVKKYPEIMEEVRRQREASNVANTACEMFTPNLAKGTPVSFLKSWDNELAVAMNGTYKYFSCEKSVESSSGEGETGTTARGQTTNAFIDAIQLIFGLNGLFDIRTNSTIDPSTGQPMVHPLAQLSTVGKSLVENAIRSMAIAVGAAFGGGFLGALEPHLGQALQSASGMFVGIATIGLTVGFILYYILPFLPFIYFFFAVGSWVKSIFEAMVGVPLWALAHLRIDGDGLPGRAAAGGYFLLFEIFLRPIIIVFGLIGGMATFGALAGMLNVLFDLVTINITGAIPGESADSIDISQIESLRRGTIDQFFFTIMYAVLLYLMANASFKMIDSVPKGIMRWLGSSVSTFNDNTGDPTSGLTRYAAYGGSQISEQIFTGMTTGAKGIGQAGGAAARLSMDQGKDG